LLASFDDKIGNDREKDQNNTTKLMTKKKAIAFVNNIVEASGSRKIFRPICRRE